MILKFDPKRPRRARRTGPLLAIGAAALVGAGIGFGMASPGASPLNLLAACRVVDGDTLRCGSERVRLLGIDAPELPGHCAEGRACAPGDPYQSSQSLKEALTGSLTLDRVGTDRYGRTLALVSGDKGDLSCWQLQHGAAIYKPQWDNGARVAGLCPAVAR